MPRFVHVYHRIISLLNELVINFSVVYHFFQAWIDLIQSRKRT